MNDKIDFDKTRMMRDSTILEMFAKQDLNFEFEWKRLNLIDLPDHMDNLDMNVNNDAPIIDHIDNMNLDVKVNSKTPATDHLDKMDNLEMKVKNDVMDKMDKLNMKATIDAPDMNHLD